MMDGKSCSKCKKICGILVILFGLAFLLKAFGILTESAVNLIWPILVIVMGVGFSMDKKCCKGACESGGGEARTVPETAGQ
jgi:hypothetical protein